MEQGDRVPGKVRLKKFINVNVCQELTNKPAGETKGGRPRLSCRRCTLGSREKLGKGKSRAMEKGRSTCRRVEIEKKKAKNFIRRDRITLSRVMSGFRGGIEKSEEQRNNGAKGCFQAGGVELGARGKLLTLKGQRKNLRATKNLADCGPMQNPYSMKNGERGLRKGLA